VSSLPPRCQAVMTKTQRSFGQPLVRPCRRQLLNSIRDKLRLFRAIFLLSPNYCIDGAEPAVTFCCVRFPNPYSSVFRTALVSRFQIVVLVIHRLARRPAPLMDDLPIWSNFDGENTFIESSHSRDRRIITLASLSSHLAKPLRPNPFAPTISPEPFVKTRKRRLHRSSPRARAWKRPETPSRL